MPSYASFEQVLVLVLASIVNNRYPAKHLLCR